MGVKQEPIYESKIAIVKTHIHILYLFLYPGVQFFQNIQVYLCENAIWLLLYFFISGTLRSITTKFCKIKCERALQDILIGLLRNIYLLRCKM